MNSIPPRNGWNNGAIYPFLVYNGRLRVKLFGAEEFTTECRFS